MMTKKRTNYISWDEYFMGIAMLSAQRSKDPYTQVGACIVNAENVIVGTGYNGLPVGLSDDDFPWARDKKDPLNNKYLYVVHAEQNAIFNAPDRKELQGAKIYCTLFPCHECVKAIIQSGIKEMVYLSDKYRGTDSDTVARVMLVKAGIRWRKYTDVF